jgi:DNA-binding CsgD family transcriptional regulator
VGHNATSASTLEVIAHEPWPAKIAALSTAELALRVVLDDHNDEEVVWQLLRERLASTAIATIERWTENGSLLHRLLDLGLRVYPCDALRADPHPYMIATEAVAEALADVRERVLPPWTELPPPARPPLEQTFTRYSLRFTTNPYRRAARLWFDPATPITLSSPGSDDPWEAVPDPAPGPDDAALLHVLADHALALLSPEDGFVLRALADGWSGREIARHLGCTANAVYIRAYDARQKLRRAGLVQDSND